IGLLDRSPHAKGGAGTDDAGEKQRTVDPPGSSPAEVAVENGGAAESTPWKQRITRDVADADPPQALIQTGGISVRDGVGHEQRLAALPCRPFDGLHERCAHPPPTCTTMHEHLHHVGSVWLVLRLIEHELNRPADARRVLRDEQCAPSGRDVFGYA